MLLHHRQHAWCLIAAYNMCKQGRAATLLPARSMLLLLLLEHNALPCMH
jgi:hypothetical protein